jgi:hypothetical protein
MSVYAPKASSVLAVTTLILLLSGCATGGSPRIYYSGTPHKSHQVAEVIKLASREEIVAGPKVYQSVLAAGLSDQDIQNGSFGVGRVFCCGGKGTVETEERAYFYIPPGHKVDSGDVVEFRVGKDADGDGPAQLNTVVRVRHKSTAVPEHCRWLPDQPQGLWMRVIYCDWMANEGWQQGGTFHPEWYKSAD